MKKIELEWCKNWVKKTFSKLPKGITGIEVNLFWKLAEESKLWTKGTYGTPMSDALSELTNVETITKNGEFLYNVFKLK
jgi:hypothetical protein